MDLTAVQQFRAGDPKAFERLMRSENGPLLNYIRSNVRSEDAADDIFQETCLRCWNSREMLKNPSKFRGWLYQIARGAIRDHLRKHVWKANILLYADWADLPEAEDRRPLPDAEVSQMQLQRLISREINQLDEQSQEVLAMRYISGMKFRDIAETLNIPLGTVCTKNFQALKLLRKRLVRLGVGLEMLR